MKKQLIFLLSLCLSVNLFAQKIIATNAIAQDTAIYYMGIVEVPGMDKNKLYDKIKLWSVDRFKYTEGVMQVQDREGGLLAYNATYLVLSKQSVTGTFEYYFKLKIQTKDYKYKYVISDIHYYPPGMPPTDKVQLTGSPIAPWKVLFGNPKKENQKWENAKMSANKEFTGLMNELHQYILKDNDF